jgi:hypothetical protein
MEPADYLDGGTVSVSTATYDVLRTDRADPSAFATVQDGTETTVVAEQGTYRTGTVHERVPGWRRLTFEMELPFELVGFLATVATALTEAGVSIYVVSAFSTDHLFVRETDLDSASTALEELGCRVEV